MQNVEVAITRLRREARLPCYMTAEAAGMDLYACPEAPVRLKPGDRALVPTGIAIALPPGFEAQIRPRSGLALKYGLTLLNSPGTIDADYRGEIGVIVINHGPEEFVINSGERIAQIVIAPVRRALWRECRELPASRRGSGGFGHTGV